MFCGMNTIWFCKIRKPLYLPRSKITSPSIIKIGGECMRRGLFIFMAWICVVGIQAQSDFSFILNKEGKIIVLPKNKTYELNIPKAY
jgi:hypothetical protein